MNSDKLEFFRRKVNVPNFKASLWTHLTNKRKQNPFIYTFSHSFIFCAHVHVCVFESHSTTHNFLMSVLSCHLVAFVYCTGVLRPVYQCFKLLGHLSIQLYSILEESVYIFFHFYISLSLF